VLYDKLSVVSSNHPVNISGSCAIQVAFQKIIAARSIASSQFHVESFIKLNYDPVRAAWVFIAIESQNSGPDMLPVSAQNDFSHSFVQLILYHPMFLGG
jgi:hypothetical protein